MGNIKNYLQFITESKKENQEEIKDVTWLVLNKEGKVVLQTRDEKLAKEKRDEKDENVLYYRKGSDPVRRDTSSKGTPNKIFASS